MNEKNNINHDTMYVQIKEYQAGLVRIATQIIVDDTTRHLFLKGAVQEVNDVLNMCGLSLSDTCLNAVEAEPLNDVSDMGIVFSDEIGEYGILQKAAKLCKDNGVLPYYIIGILSHLLLTKYATVFQNHAQYYGIKTAISKFCGLTLEPELAQLIADLYSKISADIIDTPKKIELMKCAYQEGFKNEKKYKGCAQCTLLTMFTLFGRENAVLFQSATALAAGMAHSGDGACGGYTGGIMYLGSIIGRRLDHLEDGDKESKITSYRLAQMIRDRFIATYGSVICADIHQQVFGQSFCLRTDAVKEEFEAAGAHTTKCTAIIGMTCVWLVEIIYDCGYVS